MARACRLGTNPCGAGLALALLALGLQLPARARADKPDSTSPQSLQLPTGPASLKGLGESFAVQPSTGTGSFSVSLFAPPAVLAPKPQFEYVAGAGRTEFGLSFRLPVLSIYRQTDKGAPRYDESDRFAVKGDALNDELVLVDAKARLYRLRNEGAFALFERHPTADSWTIHLPNGQRVEVGESTESRQLSLGRTHVWYIARQLDRFAHEIRYAYFRDGGHVYLESIRYQLHAAASEQNELALAYEPRPDAVTDYSTGEPITLGLRVAAITVKHGSETLRTYSFRYHETELFSLLAQVVLTGRYGEAMPPLSLGYVEPGEASGRFVTMRALPPLEGLVSGAARFEDVTGDGLADILYSKVKDYYYYENIDGLRWSQTPVHLKGSPDRTFNQDDVVVADIDGDGSRDVVHTQGNAFRYYPAGPVIAGRFSGYGAPLALTSSESGLSFGAANVKLSDVNHDGRTDLLVQKPGQDLQLINGKDGVLRSVVLPELPVDVVFSDASTLLTDFNGDGALDLVRNEIGLSRGRVRIWYGLGDGRFAAERQMLGTPAAERSECTLLDVNHDGQADLVRVSGSWATYYLNNGHDAYTTPQGSYYGLPPAAKTRRLFFADLNGNGTNDIVWLTTDGKLYYLDLVGDPTVGLLGHIDNGTGLVTDIDYRTSGELSVAAKLSGAPWLTTLPFPVPVISTLRTSDSLDALGIPATVSELSYDYRDGYFDGKEREFRGFASVIARQLGDTFQEGVETETHYCLGRDLDSGEDQEPIKGKRWLTLVRNLDGKLYHSSESRWETHWLCQEDLGEGARTILPSCNGVSDRMSQKEVLVAQAVSHAELSASWEGTSQPRVAATELELDAWGRPFRTLRHGEVSLAQDYVPGKGFAFAHPELGADEIYEETHYLDNLQEWLLGFPYEQIITDGQGHLQAHSRTFFDDPWADQHAANPSDPHTLSLGIDTLEQHWYAEENRWVSTRRSGFSAHGLPAWQEDPQGGRIQRSYDEATGSFIVAEDVRVTPFSDARSLHTAGDVDRATGEIRSVTDQNGRTFHAEYDGLGRVKALSNSDGLTLTTFSYRYGSPLSETRTETLLDVEAGSVLETVTYSDAAGRVRLRKVHTDEEYGWLASGYKLWTPLGKEARVFAAFATNNDGFEPAPDSSEQSRVRYDALGRETLASARVTPDLAQQWNLTQDFAPVRSTLYLPWREQAQSERALLENNLKYPTDRYLDGQGRVRRVERNNLAQGELQQLWWQAEYDARGNPTALIDQGQTRSYRYDSLNRLRAVLDANLGVSADASGSYSVRFEYDDAGRVLTRRDAAGTERHFVYDAAGRMTERHDDAVGEVPASVTRWHWDEGHPRFAEWTGHAAQNIAGRLGWVEYPTGATAASYDPEGRAVEQVKELWNPALSPFSAQVRDSYLMRTSHRADGQIVQRSLASISDSKMAGVQERQAHNARGLLTALQVDYRGQTYQPFQAATYSENGDAKGELSTSGQVQSCRAYDARQHLTRLVMGDRGDVACNQLSESGGPSLQNIAYHWGADSTVSRVEDLTLQGSARSGLQLAGVARLGVQYEYDYLGQVLQARYEEPSIGAHSYRYDALENLRSHVAQVGANIRTREFVYGEGEHAAAQRLSRVRSDGVDDVLPYDAAGELLTHAGFRLGYDAAGLVARAQRDSGLVIERHYDDKGSLLISVVRAEDGKTRISRYPAEGFELRDGDEVFRFQGALGTAELRHAHGLAVDLTLLAELSTYVQQGGAAAGIKPPLPNELMDLDGNGSADFDAGDLAVARAAYAEDARVGPEVVSWTFEHHDRIGSATHVCDDTGALVSQQVFLPYGERILASGLRPSLGFAGKRAPDEPSFSLVHMGARYYVPELGRFATPDRFLGEQPKKLVERLLDSHLYSYAANNPVSFVDSTGQLPDEPGNEASQRTIAVLSQFIAYGGRFPLVAPINMLNFVLAANNLRPKQVENDAKAGQLHGNGRFLGSVGEYVALRRFIDGRAVGAHLFSYNKVAYVVEELQKPVNGKYFDITVSYSGACDHCGSPTPGLIVAHNAFRRGNGTAQDVDLGIHPVVLIVEVTTATSASFLLDRAKKVRDSQTVLDHEHIGSIPIGRNPDRYAVLAVDQDSFYSLPQKDQEEIRTTTTSSGGLLILLPDLRGETLRTVGAVQQLIK